jgi:DnaJ-class molecular chaperone
MTIIASLHILELDCAQDHDQLHRAYRRQVKRWHPDQFAHQPEIHAQAEERLKRINHAYSILKEHLKKKPSSLARAANKKATETENGHQAPLHKSTKPFQWSQWFKPKKRKPSQKAVNAEPISGPRKNSKTASTRKKSSFERILREAADNPRRHIAKKISGARPYLQPHLRKQGKKGMRIESFRPVSPIMPVRPVSKISGIEGSD